MDNSFMTNSVSTSESQLLSQQPLKSTMAVNSMDFNHTMDGHPITGGGEMSGMTQPVQQMQVVSEPVGVNRDSVNVVSIEPNRQDVRLQPGAVAQKMKELENMDVHFAASIGIQRPKKGSFQITSVINRKQQELDCVDHANEDADSIGDEFDETNTEDLSSEIMDTSKMTDIDLDPSSEDTVHSLAIEDHIRGSKSMPNSMPPTRDKMRRESDEGSAVVKNLTLESEPVSSQPHDTKDDNDDSNFGATRFRIVKVSNERFMRGRWSCYDYQNSERTSREKSNEDLGSGNSSAASSVHYVPGVDDPTKNPFTTASSTVYTDSSSMTGTPIAPDMQLGHSVSQVHVANGDYSTSQPGVILGGGESSGAHDMTSSTIQPVSQPISSNHTQSPVAGYGTPATGSSTPQTSHLQQDFVKSHKDFLGQSATSAAQTSSQQSIPQTQQSVPVSQNAASTASTGTTDTLPDVPASSKPPQPTANTLGDFTTGKGTIGSAVPSNNPSPDNLQAGDFRQGDNVYPPSADDQKSNVSDDDRMSEGSMARALMSQAGLTQPLLDMVQTMHYPLGSNREEDESGASTVAIDNKIEQAMDLVKSHLMFAVREEVLVLKEQIKELLEKNSQLEYENTVLRNGASQETLDTLAQLQPVTSSGQTQTSTS